MEITQENEYQAEIPAKQTTLYFNSEMEQIKRQYRASGCPFCVERLQEKDVVLTDGVSFLRKNKMPNVAGANMYVLVESLMHEQHFEDMDTAGARGLLSFAFASMEWVKEQHKGKSVLLIKNRGVLAGGSQAHPHMQVIALPVFNPAQANFESDRILYENESLQIGIQTEEERDLYQLVLRVPTAERISAETAETMQKLLKWVVNRHGNYNLAHFQDGGHDFFKVIPRWVGAVFGHGYNHYLKYDDVKLMEIETEIRELMENNQ